MAAKHCHAPGAHKQAASLALDEATRLRPNDWSSLEVRIVDLSSSHFRARCEARLPIGSLVSLDLPGLGEVLAQVEWQHGQGLGARFVEPIALERCTWAAPPPSSSSLAGSFSERAGRRAAGGEF